jgi:alanine racemase
MILHDPDLRPDRAILFAPRQGESGGMLTIDLAAVEANWKLLAGMALPVECAAAVKANAYGCGLEAVTRTLTKAGCRTFFVADLTEARSVRTIAPDAAIYVLNGIIPGSAPAFADGAFRPVINSLTELAEWDAFVSQKGWRGGAALHVDTGMNRLGMTMQDAIAIAPRVHSETHGFTLLMSHLACADTPDHALNDQQIRMFREIRVLYRGLPASLANSSGIFLGDTVFCDLVRPGIAIFGGNPTPGRKNPMRPVVELKGRIIQVRPVDRGETVGYGASWTMSRPGRVAVVALGYGDGVLRSAAASKGKPAAEVIIAGQRCPVAGRVSMDLLTVDVTHLPEAAVRRGDFATLIGDGMSVDELASAMGTIAYEVLTGLGRRHYRIYRGR